MGSKSIPYPNQKEILYSIVRLSNNIYIFKNGHYMQLTYQASLLLKASSLS